MPIARSTFTIIRAGLLIDLNLLKAICPKFKSLPILIKIMTIWRSTNTAATMTHIILNKYLLFSLKENASMNKYNDNATDGRSISEETIRYTRFFLSMVISIAKWLLTIKVKTRIKKMLSVRR